MRKQHGFLILQRSKAKRYISPKPMLLLTVLEALAVNFAFNL
jgi:hypothetical protein